MLAAALAACLGQVEPPRNPEIFDTPGDDGESLTLRWDRMPYDNLQRLHKLRASIRSAREAYTKAGPEEKAAARKALDAAWRKFAGAIPENPSDALLPEEFRRLRQDLLAALAKGGDEPDRQGEPALAALPPQEPMEYVVRASLWENGPWIEAARFPVDSGFADEKRAPWWAWSPDPNRHFVEVDTGKLAETLDLPGRLRRLREAVRKAGTDEERSKAWAELLGALPRRERTTPIPDELVRLRADVERAQKAYEQAQGEAREAARRELERLREGLLAKVADLQDLVLPAGLQRMRAALRELEEKETDGDRFKIRLREARRAYTEAVGNSRWFVRLVVERAGREVASAGTFSVTPGDDWFNGNKANSFVFMVLFCATIVAFIRAGRRRELFLRKIPGLEAFDEAIGRATEMGRPVYFLTGREEISSISTIAAVSILGDVARKCAKLGAELKVPHTAVLTYLVSQEITKQAYTEAGRPDAYREDSNFFVTEDQFGYAAAVEGMFVRERPGAVFLMGYYFAESLLLAETGASVGAIQVAGTDADHQLPFFVTACDYTLIGEELYAAGGYLSRDPALVGTLRGQDTGKLYVMAVVVLGTILTFLLTILGRADLTKWVMDLVTKF